MKYFAILCLIGFSGIGSTAFAELDSSILEPFENSDLVIVGNVIAVDIISLENKTQYNIKIEEYLKGKTSFDMVTAILDEIIPADFPNEPLDYYNKPHLEKGNQVLVYLKQDGGTYKMSPYSFTIKKPSVAGPPTVIHPTGPSGHFLSQNDEIVISGTIKKGYIYGLEKLNLDSRFDLVILNEEGKIIESKRLNISPDGTYAFTFQDKDKLRIPGQYSWEISFENGGMGGEFVVVVDPKLWTPLKQIKSGISFDEIQCKDNLVLIQKHDGSPACVNFDTIPKLIQRGWIDTDPREEADKNIPRYLCELYGGGFFDGTGECMDLESQYKCQMLGGQWDGKCMMANYSGKGIDTEPDFDPRPEPERTSDAEMQLYDARKSLQNAYQNHVNLGPYYMKDVVMGFATYDDTLIVDIASKYTDSDSFQTVKQEIQHIVGNDIDVDYVVYDEPIERHIETVIPYLWNKILHQNKIDFMPKQQDYWNNADGFAEHDKVCSPLVASNGTEFFISSTFNLEPFEITGTYIDKTQPDGCHKIWKTDVIMQEPDRVTALWLENEN